MASDRWRRYRRFFAPNVDADVEDELRFHVEHLIADHLARGLSPAEAERLAAERFGSYETIQRALRTHDARRLRRQQRAETMDTLVQDLRYGIRKLAQTPSFTLGIVLVLALGLGANAAVFTAADAAFFRPVDAPLLVGDAGKARRDLGFTPSVDLAGLARRMVEADLARERAAST